MSSSVDRIDPRGDLKLRVGTTQKDEDNQPRCYLVCSRTLARVSPVFDRMINGSFAEAKPKDTEHWTIDLPEDNPSTLELFLNIAHGHLRKVPPALSLHELYDLTALTHFYDATKILVPWIRPWTKALHDATSGPDVAAVPKLIWIGWELGYRPMFEAAVRRVTMEEPGSTFAEGSPLYQLPMSSDIIERICAVRYETVKALLGVIRSFVELLTVVDERPRWCRHATFMGPHRCESMILGSMAFCLTRAGLWPMPEDAWDVKHSVLGLYEEFSILVIHDIGQPVEGEGDHKGCNPREYLMDQMREVFARMPSPLKEADMEQLVAQEKRLYMP
ncbi:nuclear pore protein-like protein [Triangularia setosa]|uniref:Nuclear pore protein-like protein n=1 Tax=Triangularia setosa TaxID=2587417 RepID=A0AAN7A8J9_9PEZI|nr:nuclear pore protein-like protein [Podospora setosa]